MAAGLRLSRVNSTNPRKGSEMREFVAAVLTITLLSLPARAGDNPNRAAIRQACQADITALCPNTQPGGGRIKACLKTNKAKLSEGCRSAIAAAMEARRAAKTQPATGSTQQ
ncbi:MAG: cysteine rich repeat-containing protein [Alphaproteobacteria bacterium]|nr:cysteine rich repeat-containing protein [Alphaproteobacteria bacterium]